MSVHCTGRNRNLTCTCKLHTIAPQHLPCVPPTQLTSFAVALGRLVEMQTLVNSLPHSYHSGHLHSRAATLERPRKLPFKGLWESLFTKLYKCPPLFYISDFYFSIINVSLQTNSSVILSLGGYYKKIKVKFCNFQISRQSQTFRVGVVTR